MKGGREDQSSPTEYKGTTVFFLPGKGGTEDFWRVIRFPGGLKGGPIVANKGEYSLYLVYRNSAFILFKNKLCFFKHFIHATYVQYKNLIQRINFPAE